MTDYPEKAPGPKIGILAGMGPSSTGPFLELVYQACRDFTGAVYDSDFPRIVICSQPIPFFHDRPIDDDAICNGTIDGLQDLEKAGCDFIGIACNSVHVYFQRLETAGATPILNIVEEALNAIPGDARRIAIAASRPLAESGLYQTAARARSLEVLDPDWQDVIDWLQDLVKADTDDESFRVAWAALFEKLREAGEVDAVLIACLDLTGALRHASCRVPLVDAGRELSKALVRRWQIERGIP